MVNSRLNEFLGASVGEHLLNQHKPDQPNQCIRSICIGLSINCNFNQPVSFEPINTIYAVTKNLKWREHWQN